MPTDHTTEEKVMAENRTDSLGLSLANDALTLLVRLYPAVRTAADEDLDSACAAMRAQIPSVVGTFLADAREAPTLGTAAYQTAAMTLAMEGIRSLQASRTDR